MAETMRNDYLDMALDQRAAFERLKAAVRDAAPRNKRRGIVYTTRRAHDLPLVGVFAIDQRTLEPIDLGAALAATEGWSFVAVGDRPSMIVPTERDGPSDPEEAAVAALREILQDYGFRHFRA